MRLCLQMAIKIGLISKVFVAELALEWLLSCVNAKVMCKIAFLCKVLTAELTLEWLLSCVDSVVYLQI